MKKEKSKAQKQLEEFRKTGIAYLSEEDKDFDFSKVDDPKNKKNVDNKQKLKKV